MSDPRNVAHDKKVQQEKAHHGGKTDDSAAGENGTPAVAAEEQGPGELEKSTAVLSKLKEMEHYSRANIETLAGLMLTIDDELKQKEFTDPVSALYSAQDAFQSQIATLVSSYEEKCESLRPSA